MCNNNCFFTAITVTRPHLKITFKRTVRVLLLYTFTFCNQWWHASEMKLELDQLKVKFILEEDTKA